jgi:hypothetical protein
VSDINEPAGAVLPITDPPGGIDVDHVEEGE